VFDVEPAGATSCTLLDAARAQDAEAWQRLVTLYQPLVQHWLRRAGVAPADVADVTQEVMLSVSLSLRDFEPQRVGSFRKWVRGIARHKALDSFRRAKGEPAASGGTIAQAMLQSVPEEAEDPNEEASETTALYRRALELIKGNFEATTWQAFWRTAVDDKPADVVGAELGMTAVAVRIAKSRVLSRLREDLGELIR
jgi:RNA polymerase sigma-70 factor (ECF subfamily)